MSEQVLSVAEIKAAELKAAEYGLSEDILIENAAAALKERVISLSPRGKICVLAGGGNNGADGMSLARMLFLAGVKVSLVYTGGTPNAYAGARLNACKALGVPEISADDFEPENYALIVDAMLGTGCTRPLEGTVRKLTERINRSGVYVLSADIPTGLNADTGETDFAVDADETLTFSCLKTGLLIGVGRNYCGKITVADIGVRADGTVRLITQNDAAMPKRKTVSHKYDYGRVRVVAGSPEMIGAALLAHESALAALKSGAGLCTLCVPSSLRAAYQARVKEETLSFLPDSDGKIIYDENALTGLFDRTGAILIGPGMGANTELKKIILYIAANYSGTLVIDADGLNAFKGDAKALLGSKAKLILTPHIGEFERLCEGVDFNNNATLTDKVKELSKITGAVIACKSATTVISDGNEIYLNTSGTPALSKGGSGDVLGGMIAALSIRMTPLKAAICGCYHFGVNAERAEKQYGTESLLASQIIINS